MKKPTKRIKMTLIIVLVFVVATAGVGAYFIFGSYSDGEPVIYNCGIKIATLDGSTSADGTADNDHILGFCGWGMRDFNMSNMPNGEQQLQACFKWYATQNAEVLSCVDGIVKIIEYQNYSGDYQVLIEPKIKGPGKANWYINMDHILPIAGLKVGSKVTANQVIGTPGNNQGSKWMFELEFKKNSDGQHYPSAKFLAPEIKDEYGQRMIKMMNDLEDNVYHVERSTYYDYDSMIYPASWLEAIPSLYYQPGYPGYPGYIPDSGGNQDGNHNKNAVSWSMIANGTNGKESTTAIMFTFDKDIQLTMGYIILEHATKGTLTGSGKNWTLTISNINTLTVDGEKVVVTIASPKGCKIEPITQKIAVVAIG